MATNSALNTTNPIGVVSGGLGAATYTNHGVLIGNGTSAISALSVGTNGQLLIGGSSNPAFATPTSTAGSFTFTNGAASKNIDVTNWVDKGSFTPALKFGGASVGMTYGTQTGTYCRFGKMVMFKINIVLTAKGSSVGSATITGLPVTIVAGVSYIGSISFSKLTFATGNIQNFLSAAGTTVFFFRTISGGTATSLANTAFVDTTSISLTGIYFTA